MKDNTLHLNAKLPGYKAKLEKLIKKYLKETGAVRASNADVYKWVIDRELAR